MIDILSISDDNEIICIKTFAKGSRMTWVESNQYDLQIDNHAWLKELHDNYVNGAKSKKVDEIADDLEHNQKHIQILVSLLAIANERGWLNDS